MPRRRIRLTASAEALGSTFRDIRAEIGIPESFPPEVLAEAESSSRSPRLPDVDRTKIPLVTLDPPESMDLDQAFHLTRRGGRFRLHYAIADPSGSSRRAERSTGRRTAGRRPPTARMLGRRFYPPAISEAAASLLPDGPRPAALWRVDVDTDGSRWTPRWSGRWSRAGRSSATRKRGSDRLGTADPMLELLPRWLDPTGGGARQGSGPASACPA